MNFIEAVARGISKIFNPSSPKAVSPQQLLALNNPTPVQTPRQVALQELKETSKVFATIRARLNGTCYEDTMSDIANMCNEIYRKIEASETGDIPKTHFNDLYLSNFNSLFSLLTKELKETKPSKGTEKVPENESLEAMFSALEAKIINGEAPTAPVVAPPMLYDLSFLAQPLPDGEDYLDWSIKASLCLKMSSEPGNWARYDHEHEELWCEVEQRRAAATQHLSYLRDQQSLHATSQDPIPSVEFSGMNKLQDNAFKLLLCANAIEQGPRIDIEEVTTTDWGG